MLLRGLGSIFCLRVSGEPGTFRSTFLRSRNLHAWRMMVCSSQFPPTQTMFSGIILKTKALLDIICAPRGHNIALPRKDTCNFVSRILYAVPLYAYFCSIV